VGPIISERADLTQNDERSRKKRKIRKGKTSNREREILTGSGEKKPSKGKEGPNSRGVYPEKRIITGRGGNYLGKKSPLEMVSSTWTFGGNVGHGDNRKGAAIKKGGARLMGRLGRRV